MKALKGKTLMSLIYAMCLSIPLVSILSRVIYVQSNKNAYQSYSGYNIETNTELATNIESGLNYQISVYTGYNGNINTNTPIKLENLEISVSNTTYNTWWESNKNNVYYISFAGNYTPSRFIFYDNDMQQINYWNTNVNYFATFTSQNNVILTNNDLIYKVYQQQVGNSLDNVFDYSVNQLVSENNFGQLNFFSWFTNMLLTDSQNNMLYVRFVNWYLNYALLVSLMQILFLCLMWFVNFSRKLLDRGMNYDW